MSFADRFDHLVLFLSQSEFRPNFTSQNFFPIAYYVQCKESISIPLFHRLEFRNDALRSPFHVLM